MAPAAQRLLAGEPKVRPGASLIYDFGSGTHREVKITYSTPDQPFYLVFIVTTYLTEHINTKTMLIHKIINLFFWYPSMAYFIWQGKQLHLTIIEDFVYHCAKLSQ